MNDGLYSGFGGGRDSIGRFSYEIIESSNRVSPPAWAKYVSFLIVAGGGGGGGGRCDTSAASGGGGGAGGRSKYLYRIPLWLFQGYGSVSFFCTIGAGGTGGAGGALATNGSAGGGGGNTVLTYNYLDNQVGLPSAGSVGVTHRVNGGSFGYGGSTGNAAGGAAGPGNGTNADQGPGLNGGIGIPSTGGEDTPNFGAYWDYPWFHPVGGGAAGHSRAQTSAIMTYPFYCMGWIEFLSTTYRGTTTIGADAPSAKSLYSPYVDRAFAELTRAPLLNELWFVTIPGGSGGTSGSTTVVANAGRGGDGWRGGGGGGGGCAGISGATGGTGGTGGNGYVAFFWEER